MNDTHTHKEECNMTQMTTLTERKTSAMEKNKNEILTRKWWRSKNGREQKECAEQIEGELSTLAKTKREKPSNF